MSMAARASAGEARRPMTREEKRVILASSLGTVFEWYDFYLYGSLAVMIGAHFFSAFDANTRAIFALLAFAAGFLVRPFGAIFFGRLGDLVGRKYTFLVTIVIMGLSTFMVGLLPGYNTIGWIAPVILIALRMLQGLALGGEYGGAATYVAEHAPDARRGLERFARGNVEDEIRQRAIGVSLASGRLVEHREAGAGPDMMRIEPDFLLQGRLGLLVPIEPGQRVAEHEVEVARLRASTCILLPRLGERRNRLGVAAGAVSEGAADERNERQSGLRLCRERGLLER